MTKQRQIAEERISTINKALKGGATVLVSTELETIKVQEYQDGQFKAIGDTILIRSPIGWDSVKTYEITYKDY